MAEENIEELRKKWIEKDKLIKKESKKRWKAFVVMVIVELTSTLVLMPLGIICWKINLVIIAIATIIMLVINHIVSVRIQNIIWEGEEKR
jgi:ABC-type branched-subunit amino acid transport system permease subunit